MLTSAHLYVGVRREGNHASLASCICGTDEDGHGISADWQAEGKGGVMYGEYVYFAWDESDLLMKIGRSTRPQDRIHELEIRYKRKLNLIAQTPISSHREPAFHYHFDEFRALDVSRGREWFRITPEMVLEFIQTHKPNRFRKVLRAYWDKKRESALQPKWEPKRTIS